MSTFDELHIDRTFRYDQDNVLNEKVIYNSNTLFDRITHYQTDQQTSWLEVNMTYNT